MCLPAPGAERTPPVPASLRQAIDALRSQRAVVVRMTGRDPVLMCSAAGVLAETVAFMVRHTSGFVCVALPAPRADELDIPPMHHISDGAFEVAYGVSVDAAEGIETGISAQDRAATIGLLGERTSTAEHFLRPGHVMTLRARPGGLRTRESFTEAAVDLAALAGLEPVMAMSELVSAGDPAAMMPNDEVPEFCLNHGLACITVDQIASAVSRRTRKRPTDVELRRGAELRFEERTIMGPDGDLPLLICLPTTRPIAGGVLYLHGGGMAVGGNRTAVTEVLDWVVELGLALACVDYRVAPEDSRPAGLEDGYAALTWLAEHATDLELPSDRIFVAGAGSGGGVAATAALLARDRQSATVGGQMLLSHTLDDRTCTLSTELVSEGVWDATPSATGCRALVGDADDSADLSPYAAPARAVDLAGMPAAYIEVRSVDVFRDDAMYYAQRLWQAGGSAELHVWAEHVHGRDILSPQAAIAQGAKAARINWLARQFAG